MITKELCKEIITLIGNNVYDNTIPLNYDLVKNIGVYYILDSIEDLEYKDHINLEVHLVTNVVNKLDLFSLEAQIHKRLNRATLTNGRIITKNIYRNAIIDDEENINISLEYYVVKWRDEE